MSNLVTFPGLGLSFEVNRVAFTIGSINIYWYGVLIALGIVLAILFAFRHCTEFGIDGDGLTDVVVVGVIMGILSARAYYVAMAPFSYDSIWDMLSIRDGGLAIYGGVIMAVLVGVVVCRIKKISFFAMADVCVFGLLIGQAVGRWGNFVNVEAYGGETTLPWRMGIVEYAANGTARYLEVHPTFLYESLWNIVGLIVLIVIAKRWRKFDGQMFFSYLVWYGVGRGFIEGLRTDSLYFFGTGIRVSQMLGFASALAGAAVLIWMLAVRRPGPERLWVNRQKETDAQQPEQDKEETEHGSEDH